MLYCLENETCDWNLWSCYIVGLDAIGNMPCNQPSRYVLLLISFELYSGCPLCTPFHLNICNTWACQATQSPSVVKKKTVAISMDNSIVKYNCNSPVFHKYFARIKSNIDTLSQLWNCHVNFYGTFEASHHSKLSLMSYHCLW
jgi:hypothetical protein